eukprot:COSAG02_NODE_837_length_16637_cov_5.797859_7_plen_62_part_00
MISGLDLPLGSLVLVQVPKAFSGDMSDEGKYTVRTRGCRGSKILTIRAGGDSRDGLVTARK